MIPFPGVSRKLPGGRLTTFDRFLCGRDSVLCLLRQILTLVMDLPFLHLMLLFKPPSVIRCLIQLHGIPHSVAFDQETHCTAEKYKCRPPMLKSSDL